MLSYHIFIFEPHLMVFLGLCSESFLVGLRIPYGVPEIEQGWTKWKASALHLLLQPQVSLFYCEGRITPVL